MKTIILTMATIILAFVNVFSANNNTITNTNHNDGQKEYVIYDKNSHEPLMKRVYTEDATTITKTVYKWITQKGWLRVSITKYTKGKNNYPQSVCYTEWGEMSNGLLYVRKQVSKVYDDNTK